MARENWSPSCLVGKLGLCGFLYRTEPLLHCTFPIEVPKENNECSWKTGLGTLIVYLVIAWLLPKLPTTKPCFCRSLRCSQERQWRGDCPALTPSAQSRQAGWVAAKHLSEFRFNTLSNIRLQMEGNIKSRFWGLIQLAFFPFIIGSSWRFRLPLNLCCLLIYVQKLTSL